MQQTSGGPPPRWGAVTTHRARVAQEVDPRSIACATVDTLLAAARALGAMVVESSGATIIVVPATSDLDPQEHPPLERARALGHFKTTRPIKEAARAGELPMYGRERSRTVTRGEFLTWLESRCVPSVAGPVDKDIEARVRRLGRRRARGAS
jgi:hypothetical protein